MFCLLLARKFFPADIWVGNHITVSREGGIMRKYFCLMALLAVLIVPAATFAAEMVGMYITPKFVDSLQNTGSVGGSSGVSSQTWNTIGGGVAVGINMQYLTDVKAPLRLELEYASRTSIRSEWNASLGGRENLKASWQTQTFFINGYWDIDTGSPITPYIGVGAGPRYTYESMTSGPNNARHHTHAGNWGLAFNAGAGVAYAFNENVSLDIGYRFAGLGESELKHRGNTVRNYMTTNEFLAGMRLSF